tara:strand:+ start:16131 stop:18491 length:2361 start_codon:yes stop_codon:yes gene_type:complete
MIPISQIPNAPTRGGGVTQIRAPRQARVDTSTPRLRGTQISADKFKVPGAAPGLDDSHIAAEWQAQQNITRAIGGVAKLAQGIHGQIVAAEEQGYNATSNLEQQQLHSELGLNFAERGDYDKFGTETADASKAFIDEKVANAPRGIAESLRVRLETAALRFKTGVEVDALQRKQKDNKAATVYGAELMFKSGDLEGGLAELETLVGVGQASSEEVKLMARGFTEDYRVQVVKNGIAINPMQVLRDLTETNEHGEPSLYVDEEIYPNFDAHRQSLIGYARKGVSALQSAEYNTMMDHALNKGKIYKREEVLDKKDRGLISPGMATSYIDRFIKGIEPEWTHKQYDDTLKLMSQYDEDEDEYGEWGTLILASISKFPTPQQERLREIWKRKQEPLNTKSQVLAETYAKIDRRHDAGGYGAVQDPTDKTPWEQLTVEQRMAFDASAAAAIKAKEGADKAYRNNEFNNVTEAGAWVTAFMSDDTNVANQGTFSEKQPEPETEVEIINGKTRVEDWPGFLRRTNSGRGQGSSSTDVEKGTPDPTMRDPETGEGPGAGPEQESAVKSRGGLRGFLKRIFQKDTPEPAERAAIQEQVQTPEVAKTVIAELEKVDPVVARNPLNFANKYLGIDENNPKHQATVKGFLNKAVPGFINHASEVRSDDSAWCAAFVNSVLHDGGFNSLKGDGYNLLRAKEYANVGSPVSSITNAKPGDILVVKSKTSGSYHVAFYAGMKGGQPLLLGGNQSDKVNIQSLGSKRTVAHIRRVEGVEDMKKVNLEKIQSSSIGPLMGTL